MFIALPKENENIAGAIVYWRLSGEVNGTDFKTALIEQGLEDHLLNMPSPHRALRRAMQEYASGSLFIRKHKGANVLFRQEDNDGTAECQVIAEARLTVGGQPKIAVKRAITPDLEKDLTSRYWHHVFHATTTDISSWLIGQAAACDALSLRESGGIYFVPRHKITEWEARVAAVHTTTDCKIHNIPAMRCEDAIDTIFEALTDECETLTNQVQEDVDSEELGERALRTRVGQAKTMLEKLSRYEGLLGGRIDSIREQVEEQQANAVQAALAASASAAGGATV